LVIEQASETSKKIKILIHIAEKRKNEAEPEGMNQDFVNPVLSYLTDEEKTELHNLKLSLPSAGMEQLNARLRVKNRIDNRRKKGKN